MRYVFTDKWNSFWHWTFGLIAIWIPMIVPVFVYYQLFKYDDNSIIDLGEFGVGYLCSFLLKRFSMPEVPISSVAAEIASSGVVEAVL
jgi:hypothetical protein